MRREDLDPVVALGDEVHQSYPEEPKVARERFGLFSDGCLTLAEGDEIAGYVFSHPWIFGDAPKLNTLLGCLPDAADIYYLHDIVVAPRARSGQLGAGGVQAVKDVARRRGFSRVGLVAVNDSARFWMANGFRFASVSGLDEKLRSYDDEARYMICELT